MKYEPLLQTDQKDTINTPSFESKYFFKALAASLSIPLQILTTTKTLLIAESDMALASIGIASFFLMHYAGWEYFYGAFFAFKNIFHELPTSMDILISLSSYAAWAFAATIYFDPDFEDHKNEIPNLLAAPLITLTALNISQCIKSRVETKIAQKKNHVETELRDYLPQHPLNLTNNKTRQAYEIRTGDCIIINSQQSKIPADGIVVEGSVNVKDLMSGEQKYAQKGDKVYAGSRILSTTTFHLQADANAGENLADKMLAVLRKPNQKPTNLTNYIGSITRYFVPTVILAGALNFAGWWRLGDNIHMALTSMMGVFSGACPCTFGLAFPLSTTILRYAAMQLGILIHNEAAILHSSQITQIVFDKNGTLTTPEVNKIKLLKTGFNEHTVLQWAASLEANSQHPYASAILRYARSNQITNFFEFDHTEQTNLGIYAQLGHDQFLIGGVEFMQQNNIPITRESESNEFCLFAKNHELIALIELTPHLRSEAKPVINTLLEAGFEITLLSGSSEAACQEIGNSLGIKDIRADKNPMAKRDEIQAMDGKVLFVGDGVNDALAAEAAFMSVAVGNHALSNHTDATISTHLQDLITLFNLNHDGQSNIKQNVAWSIAYNFTMMNLAILAPFFELHLTPAVFGSAMASSSLIVMLNASRLTRLINSNNTELNEESFYYQPIQSPTQHNFTILHTPCTNCTNAVKKRLSEDPNLSECYILGPTNGKCTVTITSELSSDALRCLIAKKLENSKFKLESSAAVIFTISDKKNDEKGDVENQLSPQ